MGEALASDGDGLTWEAATNEVHRLDPFKIQGADVSIPRDIGPVFRKDALTERVNLHLPAAAPSGAFESKVEPSNPAKE